MNIIDYYIFPILLDNFNIYQCITISKINKELHLIQNKNSFIWKKKLPQNLKNINLIFPLHFYVDEIWMFSININNTIELFDHKMKWILYTYYCVKYKNKFVNNSNIIQNTNKWDYLIPLFNNCLKNNNEIEKQEQYWIRKNSCRWIPYTDLIRVHYL